MNATLKAFLVERLAEINSDLPRGEPPLSFKNYWKYLTDEAIDGFPDDIKALAKAARKPC